MIIKIYDDEYHEVKKGQIFIASREEDNTLILTSKDDPLVGTENDLIRKELLVD